MAILNRAQIVEKTHGYRTELVPVPEWGGEVLVRELNSTEVTRIGASTIESHGTDLAKATIRMEEIADLMPQLVAWAVVDEELKPLLTLEDVRTMTAAHMETIQMLGLKALELSGLTEEVPDEVEEPVPN